MRNERRSALTSAGVPLALVLFHVLFHVTACGGGEDKNAAAEAEKKEKEAKEKAEKEAAEKKDPTIKPVPLGGGSTGTTGTTPKRVGRQDPASK